ncbi:MAG: tetratricopeptide repeat protein [Spirochaetota bacterium]
MPARGADYAHFEKKAIIEYDAEMYDFAQENFENAVRMNPSAYRSHAYLGHLAIKEGHRKEALIHYNTSLSIRDDQPDVHFRAGSIYDYLMQYGKAQTHFLSAVEHDPSHLMAHVGLCRNYSLSGDFAAANSHYTRAYELGKDRSTILLNEAEQMQDKGKARTALLLLTRAIEVNPAHTECYFKASTIRRGQRQYAEAIAILQKLVYYRPHEERAWVHIANIYYSQRVLGDKMRDYTAAIYSIRKALELNPDDIRYLELLEDCYKQTKDRDNYLKVREKIDRLVEEDRF